MPDITAKELKERIAAGENLYILDVREPAEYEEANINGKLIPLGTLPLKLSEIEDWKNKEVIVHCRSGKRSANAQAYMEMNGFENVRNLEGGILAFLSE
ncbi:MAG: rhodanese-like domain-containing protein [Cytophagales bacterium]